MKHFAVNCLNFALLAITALLTAAVTAQESTQLSPSVTNEKTAPASGEKSSVAAQQLLTQIREHEGQAEQLASSLRKLRSQTGDEKTITAQHRQLKEVLAQTFELKLQFEELQVKELQGRLKRFEQQIAQRKEWRDKIIEHRANQMVDNSGFDWESPASDSSASATASTTSSPNSYFGPSADMPATAPPKLPESSPAQLLLKVLQEHFPQEKVQSSDLINGAVLLTGEVSDVNIMSAIQQIAGHYASDSVNHMRLKAVPVVEADLKSKSVPIENRVKQTPFADSNGKVSWPVPYDPESREVNVNVAQVEIDKAMEQLREKIEPWSQRFLAAKKQIQSLEKSYFQEAKGGAEIRSALAAISAAKKEFTFHRQEVERFKVRLQSESEMAVLINSKAENAWHSGKQKLSLGGISEAEAKLLLIARDEAAQQLMKTKSKLIDFGKVASELIPPSGFGYDLAAIPHREAVEDAKTQLRPEVARLLVQATLGVELELVQCEDLKLWFKSALLIKHADGKLFQPDDLIVLINSHTFGNWNEAASACALGINSTEVCSLSKGIAGDVQNKFGLPKWYDGYLSPGLSSIRASERFEVKVVDAETGQVEIKYLTGTFLSPDGLMVIPVSSKLLAPGENLVPINMPKDNVRVVAANNDHQLILAKYEGDQATNSALHPWLKCLSSTPVKGQKLSIPASETEVVVNAIGLEYTQPILGNDAFAVSRSGRRTLDPGAALIAIDGNLQGIIYSGDHAMPAVHIEKLLNDYLTTLK